MKESEVENLYDEFLDEIYETVMIAGLEYNTSYALKNLDEIAYREGLLEFADSEGIEIE